MPLHNWIRLTESIDGIGSMKLAQIFITKFFNENDMKKKEF